MQVVGHPPHVPDVGLALLVAAELDRRLGVEQQQVGPPAGPVRHPAQALLKPPQRGGCLAPGVLDPHRPVGHQAGLGAPHAELAVDPGRLGEVTLRLGERGRVLAALRIQPPGGHPGQHGQRPGPGQVLVGGRGRERTAGHGLGREVPAVLDQVAGPLHLDRAVQHRLAAGRRDRGDPAQGLLPQVEKPGRLAAAGEVQQQHRVGPDRVGGQPVHHRLDFQRIQRLDRGQRAVREQLGGGIRVAGCDQQLQRRAELAAPPVLGRGAAQHHRIRGGQGGEIVPDRAGQVPPLVLAGGEREAGRQRRGEVALDAGGRVHHRPVQQRQPAHLREQQALRRGERDQGLVQDRGHRAGRLVRPPGRLGQRGHILAGPRRPGRGQGGGRGPSPGGPPERGDPGGADVQAEAVPAELPGLRLGERQVGRGQLEIVGPAQPGGAFRQVPGQHDQVLVGIEPPGHPLDDQPGLPLGVVRVVDDERAALAGQARQQRVDRAGRVLRGARHARRGLGEPGRCHRRADPRGQQPGRHAALMQYHVDRHRPPRVGQLGTEDGLAVAGSRLHHDDAGIQALRGQPLASDVVWRQMAQCAFPRPVRPAPGGRLGRERAAGAR